MVDKPVRKTVLWFFAFWYQPTVYAILYPIAESFRDKTGTVASALRITRWLEIDSMYITIKGIFFLQLTYLSGIYGYILPIVGHQSSIICLVKISTTCKPTLFERSVFRVPIELVRKTILCIWKDKTNCYDVIIYTEKYQIQKSNLMIKNSNILCIKS